MLCAVNISFAQTDEQRQKIKNSYDAEKATQLTKQIADYSKQQKAEVKRLVSLGFEEKIFNADGSFDQLMGTLADGSPIYNSIENQPAGIATRAADLHTGGSLGLGVNGENMVAYIWDGGRVRSTHQEFTGVDKIEQVDDLTEAGAPGELNGQSFHSTHVTGTFAANGIAPAARGMAPAATIKAYVWNDDLNEINNASFNGALVSNQSYGSDPATYPDWAFGAYVSPCLNYDAVVDAYEYFLPLNSVGNTGGNTTNNAEPLNGNVNYDKLTFRKLSKNGISVANGMSPVYDANGNVTSFGINGTSTQGPTDDLRIKPDITGIGTSVQSCVDNSDSLYNTFTGSSMAAPTVAGTLLLLQQHYGNVTGFYMKGNTLKGLALHTAVDGLTTGPDAISGWGLINAKAAAEVITNSGTTTLVEELNLANGASYSIDVTTDGTEPLLVSISWFDVADPSNVYDGAAGANAGAKVLVNDLDLRVTNGGTTHYPWRLTGVDTNANDGDNDRDPFERVDINNPVAGTYTITVTHKGTLPAAGENYSLILSGATATVLSIAENNVFEGFNLYPNPTNDNISIRFNNSDSSAVTIKVIDVLGRTVITDKSKSLNSVFSKTISLRKLTSGMYFIQTIQNDKSYVKQVLKK